MNKTLQYLVPSLINNIYPESRSLRNILIEEGDNCLVIGFYSGINEFDDDDTLYVIFRFLSSAAYNRVLSHSKVLSHRMIGGLLDNRVIVKFKLDVGLKKKFKNGAYSKLYNNEMVENLISNNHITMKTAAVFTKSPELKSEIENVIGSSLPHDAELDSSLNLNDEIYHI